MRVVRGEAARANGGDVMMLLEEYPADGVAGPPPGIPRAVYWKAKGHFAEKEKREQDRVAQFGQVRETFSMEHGDTRLVVAGRRIIPSRKKWKFFLDFLPVR